MRRRSPSVFHLLPHSHCDAGYKKTVDEYYETEVRSILNSVLIALEQDVTRRFVWAETVYLARWLYQDPRTTDQQRKHWKNLIEEGRIEIANGGFVMHDEAISRYDSQIHQMTYGHNLLTGHDGMSNKNSPFAPHSGFQIDPFGPSSFSVVLHAQSGMKSVILNRIPQHIKDELQSNQSLQFHWEVAATDTRTESVFVHVLDNHYESPHGFDWEDLVHAPTPITRDNVEQQSDAYMSVVQSKTSYYKTNQILIPFGGDFRFQNASWQFENMELILQYVNSHPDRYGGDTLRYSTVGDYMAALFEHSQPSQQSSSPFPTIQGSPFLPYWSGFYTQIPALKQMVRTTELCLKALEVRLSQLVRRRLFLGERADVVLDSEDFNYIMRVVRGARETVYLLQHHDALPATSYRFVLADYMKRLGQAFTSMSKLLSWTLLQEGKSEMSGTKTQEDQCVSYPLNSCTDENIMVGGGPYLHETLLVRGVDGARGIHLERVVDPKMGFLGVHLAVLNSLGWTADTVVHFVCSRPDVAIVHHHYGVNETNSQNIPITSQATPLEEAIDSPNLGLFLISFRVKVPPMGESRYSVHVCDVTWSTDQDPPRSIPSLQCAERAKQLTVEDITNNGLPNSAMHVEFNPATNDISLLEGPGGQRISLSHDIVLYDGTNDTIYDMRTDLDHSGPTPLLGSSKREMLYGYAGPIFSQATVRYASWLTVRYRLMNLNHHQEQGDLDSLLEVSMLSGPLPPTVNVASRFQTDLDGATEWYNDENGFQPAKAAHDKTQGIGYSIRPFVSRSWLKEAGSNKSPGCPISFSLYTVDPRGVVSRIPGSMEVVWQRRNNNTIDWWKQGEDRSTMRSSIWLELSCTGNDGGQGKKIISHRRTSAMLSNDVILMSLGNTEPTIPPAQLDQVFPKELHLLSSTVSGEHTQTDESSTAMTWIDLQIENLSDTTTSEVDLSKLLPGHVVKNAALYSLTYLHNYGDEAPMGQPDRSLACVMDRDNKGSAVLVVGPRQICSVRIPLRGVHSDGFISVQFTALLLAGAFVLIVCSFCVRQRLRTRDVTFRQLNNEDNVLTAGMKTRCYSDKSFGDADGSDTEIPVPLTLL